MHSQAILAEIPRLRRYARALLGDRAAADDLVQDTLERAWSRIAQWRLGSDMRAWLFSIMHNLRVDQLRRPSLATEPVDEDALVAATRPTQADELEMKELESALRQLPAEYREVLLLVALEELSYEQVAATLGIPLGTVMSRLSRARERLRRLLAAEAPAPPLKIVR